MTQKRSFLSPSIRISGFVDIVLLLALSGTWLGLMGRWHWVLDLFSHFRWQYVVICVLGAGWSFWLKRSKFVQAACLVSLLFNAIELFRLKGDPAYGTTEGKRFRVVSLNVFTGNPDKQRVLDYLASMDGDVIFLMEVDAAWAAALEPLKAAYPHHLLRSQEDNFGCALFSHVPLLEARVFQSDASAMPSVYARLMHEGKEMVIVGTHPLPPIGPRMSASRNAQLANIAAMAAGTKLPLLVVGDLNATPWSWGMHLIRQGNELGYRSRDAAWSPTWKVGTPFAVAIDHALCTPPLVIAERHIGPDVGSDHRPQELEIGWQR